MTDNAREPRDVLAECMRRERLGLVRPLWADWCQFDDQGGPEEWRRRADHLIRLLKENGVSLLVKGEKSPSPSMPASSVICRAKLNDREAERIIRKADGANWQIVTLEGGVETIEQTFTVQEAIVNGGDVLTEHPNVRKIPGLGRRLAALNEIFRLCAQAMEPSP